MGKALPAHLYPFLLVDPKLPALPSLSPRWRVLGTMGMANPLPNPTSLPSLSPRERELGTMGMAYP